jgi:hypothetical protein
MAVVAVMMVGGSAHAAEATIPKTGQSTYGLAGCGLGSMVFGDQQGLIQVVAATLNGIGMQTFAITTGTSNCVESAAGRGGASLFIEANREALAKDAARGSGETIVTLSHLAGCKDPGAVGARLQRSYPEVFPSADAKSDVVVENVLSVLESDESLACIALGS